MRSCLIQLLVTVAVVFALLWFGLPFGASWLATNALGAAGFTGTNTKVDVSADLPPRMLLGHADTVELTSSQVSVGDLNAATVDLTLTNVEFFNRTIGGVDGTFTGVRVPASNGEPVTLDKVTVSGSGTLAQAALTMSVASAQSLAESQLTSQTGLAGTVKFAASSQAANRVPVTVTVNGQSQQASLQVIAGAFVLVPASAALPSVTLIKAGTGNPFTLNSVSEGPSGVTLAGTIDLQSLLGL
jgi:hypothetical protein